MRNYILTILVESDRSEKDFEGGYQGLGEQLFHHIADLVNLSDSPLHSKYSISACLGCSHLEKKNHGTQEEELKYWKNTHNKCL